MVVDTMLSNSLMVLIPSLIHSAHIIILHVVIPSRAFTSILAVFLLTSFTVAHSMFLDSLMVLTPSLIHFANIIILHSHLYIWLHFSQDYSKTLNHQCHLWLYKYTHHIHGASTTSPSPIMNADSGCAVSSDGTLLDASEITWYNDADDETPLNAPPSPVPGPSTIHPFFQRSSKPPATKVAGARRSNRATRPSARVTDPNNAEASIRSGKKRMRSPSVPSRRISRQVTISDTAEVADISSAASSEFEQIATDDDDVDDDGSIPPVSMAFIRSQDMADADHEVRINCVQ